MTGLYLATSAKEAAMKKLFWTLSLVGVLGVLHHPVGLVFVVGRVTKHPAGRTAAVGGGNPPTGPVE